MDEREKQVDRLVRVFYERGLADELLGPIFSGAIQDWEGHFKIVADFWSHVLYNTGRYKGSPFAPHMKLDFGAEAFDRWLELFRAAAADTLPPLQAQIAVQRAEHMTESFRVGMFPFVKDGKPSRRP